LYFDGKFQKLTIFLETDTRLATFKDTKMGSQRSEVEEQTIQWPEKKRNKATNDERQNTTHKTKD